jgi:hypothetical protein
MLGAFLIAPVHHISSAQRRARECARYNPWAVACLFIGVAVVSGCATYPSGNQQQVQYVLGNDTAKPLQDENLNGFLAQAPAGAVLNLVQSPLGR